MSDNFLPISFSTIVTPIEISSEQFKRMGKTVKKLSPARKKEIERDVDNYMTWKHLGKVEPRPNLKMRARLKRVGKLAKALADEISGDGSVGSDAIPSCMLNWNMNPEVFASDLYRFGALLRHAAEIFPKGKSGKVDDIYIDPLVRKLYGIFLKAGGKGIYTKNQHVGENPYSGPFFTFLSIALEGLPEGYKFTPLALAKVIERAALSRYRLPNNSP